MAFTADDDERLCYYLARVLPDKAGGGRLGLKVYEKLVNTVGTCAFNFRLTIKFYFQHIFGQATVKRTHAWSARHTAASWKERYKNNAVKFDEWIEDVVKQEGQSRKQSWPEDRRASQKALRGKHRYESGEDSSEVSYEEEQRPPPRKRRQSDHSTPPPKRRQVVQRSSDQGITTRSSSDRKGKARALAEEDEDELDQLG